MSAMAKLGRGVVRLADGLVNLATLTLILLLAALSLYAMWDSDQVYHAADAARYEIYKPTIEDEGKSFVELQTLNPEVFAWLTVYGTNIDYPVTQGEDNMKYVNTNAEGLYSLSGSIFLDCGNSRDFSDFNSILYGHHMEKQAMFGEIGNFSDAGMFDKHRYGNLYFNGQDHGLEFFAFVHTDAYDGAVFTANVTEEEQRQAYLDGLLAKAMYTRDIGVTAADHIILLSTCSASSTNGRDILVGRITDGVYEDPYINVETSDGREQSRVDGQSGVLNEILEWPHLPCAALAALLILLPVIQHRRNRRKRSK